jgi:hypothetical protein
MTMMRDKLKDAAYVRDLTLRALRSQAEFGRGVVYIKHDEERPRFIPRAMLFTIPLDDAAKKDAILEMIDGYNLDSQLVLMVLEADAQGNICTFDVVGTVD